MLPDGGEVMMQESRSEDKTERKVGRDEDHSSSSHAAAKSRLWCGNVSAWSCVIKSYALMEYGGEIIHAETAADTLMSTQAS